MHNLKSIFAAFSFGMLSSCSLSLPEKTTVYSDKSWGDTNSEYFERIFFNDHAGNHKDYFRFIKVTKSETIKIYVTEPNLSEKKIDSLMNKYFENGTIPRYH